MNSFKRNTLLLLILSLVLLLSACSSTSTYKSEVHYPAKAAKMEMTKGEEGHSSDQSKIIKNANLTIESDDPGLSLSEIEKIVLDLKGKIDNSSSRKYQGYTSSYLQVRVPSSDLEKLIKQVEQKYSITHKQINSSDITSSYIDAEARLKNAKEQEKRVKSLLDKAKTVEEILSVGRELDQLQERIEVAEGQIKYWDNEVDMSQVNIDINLSPSLLPKFQNNQEVVNQDEFKSSLRQGIDNSLRNFINFLAIATVVIVNNLFLILFALAIIIILWIIIAIRSRKKRKRRLQEQAYFYNKNNPAPPYQAPIAYQGERKLEEVQAEIKTEAKQKEEEKDNN